VITLARSFRSDEFGDYLTFERGLSDRTVRAYQGDLQRLLGFLEEQGIGDPGSVDHDDLRSYVTYLKEEGLAPNSIRRALSSMRTYFAFLVEEGELENDPTERLESPRTWRKLPTVLSREEVEKILTSPSPKSPSFTRDRAILEMLYATGLRVSELVQIQLADLDLDEKLVQVSGKGDRERIVPFGSTAAQAVRDYLNRLRVELDRGETEGILFLNMRGRPLTRMSIWMLVRDATAAAGISKRVSPHTLRHTFATHMLEGGADLVAVQELLGHVDISTTQIYTHMDRDYLKHVHKRFHPRS
jgi:integrase/recombinase XerD